MIVEFRENKRTLRGAGSNRKFRYTRRVLLQCEICGIKREVNCTPKIKQSEQHPCKPCKAKENGEKNKGRTMPHKGYVKPFDECNVGKAFTNSSGYLEIYVGNAFDKKQRKDKYRLLHKLVAEVIDTNYDHKHDLVHHIDGDKTHNNPHNLSICKSKAIHQDIHSQLESISMLLVQKGIIQFNHDTQQYYLPHLEEILNAYSVNSEETYSLQISKSGDMAILNQADSRWNGSPLQSKVGERCLEASFASEGATTILLGSRVQENSKRGES